MDFSLSLSLYFDFIDACVCVSLHTLADIDLSNKKQANARN